MHEMAGRRPFHRQHPEGNQDENVRSDPPSLNAARVLVRNLREMPEQCHVCELRPTSVPPASLTL